MVPPWSASSSLNTSFTCRAEYVFGFVVTRASQVQVARGDQQRSAMVQRVCARCG
jgi:hypothetical protein